MAKTFDKNAQKLQKLLSLMDEDTLTKEDFVRSFQQVVQIIRKNDAKNAGLINEAVNRLESTFNEMKNTLEKEQKAQKEAVNQIVRDATDRFLKESEQTMNFMRDKARDLKDGKDADEDKIIEKAVEKLAEVIPDMPELQIPDEIYQGIEDNAEAIEQLRKDMKVQQSTQRMGGGTSAIGVASAMKHIVKSETPSGAIDGANTAYTVSQPINAVLSFGINGMVIHPSEYTVAGKTITMDTALDASLSGTTFEITYL